MPLPGSRYLAMQGKLLRSATGNVDKRIGPIILSKKQRVAQAESKNPYWNQECGPTFLVICKAQILCFAGLHAQLERRPTRDQMNVFFNFF